MKYIPLLLLWLVILAGTWTDLGQDMFGPTEGLREIGRIGRSKVVSREPNYVKTPNPNLVKAHDHLKKGEVKEAVMEYEAGLSNKEWAHQNPKMWAANLRTLVSTIDPNLTYELLSSFIGQGSVPISLRESAGIWRLHAREWANSGAPRSAEQNIADVKMLLERADSLKAKNPNRPDSLILYLRSAAQMKALLQADEKNQEGLFLAGRAAEGLKNNEAIAFYYEKCASIDPNSKLGQTCLKRQETARSLTASHPVEETAD